MRAWLLSALLLVGCERTYGAALSDSGKLLDEDVICSGASGGCGGAGAGFTCIGRHTGREVYCSAHTDGRCVIVHGVQFGQPRAERTCATTAAGEICRERP